MPTPRQLDTLEAESEYLRRTPAVSNGEGYALYSQPAGLIRDAGPVTRATTPGATVTLNPQPESVVNAAMHSEIKSSEAA